MQIIEVTYRPITRRFATRLPYIDVLRVLGTMEADREIWIRLSGRLDSFYVDTAEPTIVVQAGANKAMADDVVILKWTSGEERYRLHELTDIFCIDAGEYK